MSDLCRMIWCALIGLFRSRTALEAEILVLRHQLNVCLPKIISGRNDGAARTRSGWRQWYRTAELPDPAARLCPRPSASGPDYSRPHKKKEFAAGAPPPKPTLGPDTRAGQCRLDVQHTAFAM